MSAPTRICLHPGCRALTDQAKCPEHRTNYTEGQQSYEQTPERQESHRFYNTTRWRNLRRKHLRSSPLCAHCLTEDRTTLANQVDHVVPRKERPDLAMDPTNLQSLCPRHHAIKTRQGQ